MEKPPASRHPIGRRLDSWAAHAGRGAQTALANALGIDKTRLSHLKGGKLLPTIQMEAMARHMGVALHWLLTGEGTAPEWWPAERPDDRPRDDRPRTSPLLESPLTQQRLLRLLELEEKTREATEVKLMAAEQRVRELEAERDRT